MMDHFTGANTTVDVRRVRVVPVDLQFLVELMKGGEPRSIVPVADALPADAVVLRVGLDQDGRLRLIVASGSFEVVEPHGPIATHPPTQFMLVTNESLRIPADRSVQDGV